MEVKSKTYVWSFLGRLSHWLLVSSFFASYITSFYENLLILHITFGIVAFGIFIMKIFWGLIGPYYAQWKHYKFSLADLKLYFKVKVENRYREIEPGHNAASSWFAFLVVWLGIILCIAGFLLYGIQDGSGPFSFLNEKYYMYMEEIENLHIILTYALLIMITAHISGVLIEQFYHKTNMVMAMVSGYKRANGNDTVATFCMKLFGSTYIIVVLSFAFYTYYVPNNMITKSKFTTIDYKKLHSDFQFECSDCHNLFPPFMLPKESWKKLMANQHEHFKEDLELEDSLVQSIEKFLIENSSETSTREFSYKITKELGDSGNFIITKTNYWKELHKNISDEEFKSDKIETKSNCIGCHKDFEKGILSDINITYSKK